MQFDSSIPAYIERYKEQKAAWFKCFQESGYKDRFAYNKFLYFAQVVDHYLRFWPEHFPAIRPRPSYQCVFCMEDATNHLRIDDNCVACMDCCAAAKMAGVPIG